MQIILPQVVEELPADEEECEESEEGVDLSVWQGSRWSGICRHDTRLHLPNPTTFS